MIVYGKITNRVINVMAQNIVYGKMREILVYVKFSACSLRSVCMRTYRCCTATTLIEFLILSLSVVLIMEYLVTSRLWELFGKIS